MYVTDPDHPLVKGVPTFTVDDELYLCKFHGEHQTCCITNTGPTPENSARRMDERHRRTTGAVHSPAWRWQVLYLNLRTPSRQYDMQPYIEEYLVPEEGMENREFYESLRRGTLVDGAMTLEPMV
jgi:hypothetical protein